MLLHFIQLASFFSETGGQVAAGVIVLVISGAIGLFVARIREKRTTQKVEEQSANEKLDTALALVGDMHVALVGAKPSEMNPNPPPGLIKDVALIKKTLYENGGRGNTVLDRLDRMEKKVTAGVAGVERVETQQTVLRDAAALSGDNHGS